MTQSVPENVRFPGYVLAKDCGEFTEYRTLQDMRAYMEAIDVEGNEYDAWDVEGFMLKLTTRNSKRASGCTLREPKREFRTHGEKKFDCRRFHT
jgi:hypothetical protein